jgi:hypothetical protein
VEEEEGGGSATERLQCRSEEQGGCGFCPCCSKIVCVSVLLHEGKPNEFVSHTLLKEASNGGRLALLVYWAEERVRVVGTGGLASLKGVMIVVVTLSRDLVL